MSYKAQTFNLKVMNALSLKIAEMQKRAKNKLDTLQEMQTCFHDSRALRAYGRKRLHDKAVSIAFLPSSDYLCWFLGVLKIKGYQEKFNEVIERYKTALEMKSCYENIITTKGFQTPIYDIADFYYFWVTLDIGEAELKPYDLSRLVGKIIDYNYRYVVEHIDSASKFKKHAIICKLARYYNENGSIYPEKADEKSPKNVTELLYLLLENYFKRVKMSKEEAKKVCEGIYLQAIANGEKDKIQVEPKMNHTVPTKPGTSSHKKDDKPAFSLVSSREQDAYSLLEECFDKTGKLLQIPQRPILKYLKEFSSLQECVFKGLDRKRMKTELIKKTIVQLGEPSILWLLDEYQRNVCKKAKDIFDKCTDDVLTIDDESDELLYKIREEQNSTAENAEKQSPELIEVSEDNHQRLLDVLGALDGYWSIVNRVIPASNKGSYMDLSYDENSYDDLSQNVCDAIAELEKVLKSMGIKIAPTRGKSKALENHS